MRWFERNEEMYMVGHAADTLRSATEPTHGSAKVFMQLFAPLFSDKWFPVLGGENEMKMKTRVS